MNIETGAIISLLGLIIAYMGYTLNKQKDVKSTAQQEATQGAQVTTQLQYISKGVDDIRIDLKANERQMAVLAERVTRVEESVKQSHKRLDELTIKGE